MYTARYLRTTLVHWNSQGFPSYVQGPSTSLFAIIVFTRMHARDLSRYSLSTWKIRLLTYLPSLWHKMTFNVIVAPCAASNLSHIPSNQSEGVLWNLGTLVLTYGTCLPVPRHDIVTTFQLIPAWLMTSHFNLTVFSWHSTSSSIAELVSFC